MKRTRKPRWDKHAIKAAIHRRGKSLSDLATENGLEESACRVALVRHHAAGEKAIADFLGFDPRMLWPGRYRPGSDSQAQSKPAGVAPASPKSATA